MAGHRSEELLEGGGAEELEEELLNGGKRGASLRRNRSGHSMVASSTTGPSRKQRGPNGEKSVSGYISSSTTASSRSSRRGKQRSWMKSTKQKQRLGHARSVTNLRRTQEASNDMKSFLITPSSPSSSSTVSSDHMESNNVFVERRNVVEEEDDDDDDDDDGDGDDDDNDDDDDRHNEMLGPPLDDKRGDMSDDALEIIVEGIGKTPMKRTNSLQNKASAKKAVKQWIREARSGPCEMSLRNRRLGYLPSFRKIVDDSALRKNLAILDLNHNKLRRVPDFVTKFDQLVELHIDHNRLDDKGLPLDMSALVSLRLLSASHNRITKFPAALSTIPQLEHLILRDNRIRTLMPAENLQSFKEKLLNGLGKSLKTLDLAINELEGSLDANFCECFLDIEQISLHTNVITELPDCFKKMEKLRVLNANGNLNLLVPPLSVVRDGPDAVRAFFTSLQSDGEWQRNGSPNRSRSASLVKLEPSQALQDNSPDVQGFLSSVSLSSVEQKDEPSESLHALGKEGTPQASSFGSVATLERIGSARSGATADEGPPPKKRNFKVVVLGNSSAGKSSMILTLVNGTAQVTAKEDRTFGVDISKFELETGEDETQSLTIWDFAGQDVYYRSHQLFLSPRTLYLLVWDVTKFSTTEIDSEVMFWIYSVQARVPGSVVQIVASKTDLIEKQEVDRRIRLLFRRLNQHEEWQKEDLIGIIEEEERSRDLGDHVSCRSLLSLQSTQRKEIKEDIHEDFHENRPRVLLKQRPRVQHEIVQISSKSGFGFDDLKSRLLQLVQDKLLFPHVGTGLRIPRPWGIVEDALDHLRLQHPKMPVCSWESLAAEVGRLATDEHVTVDPSHLVQCVRFLNDIGDIVHNKGFSMVFLEPNWIVRCIRRIVDHRIVQNVPSRVGSRFSTKGSRRRGPTRNQLMQSEGAVSRDVQTLIQKGILTEFLVKRLWSDLLVEDKADEVNQEVYNALLHVLEHFDVISPLEPSQQGSQWLVPCLITRTLDLVNRWPKLDPSCENIVQIGRTFVFREFRPPGIMGKLLTRIVSDFPPKDAQIRTWKDASIIRLYDSEVKVLVRLTRERVFSDAGSVASSMIGDDDAFSDSSTMQFDTERCVIDICVQGSPASHLEIMWDRLETIRDEIENVVLEEYMGVTCFLRARCPVCVAQLGPEDMHKAFSFHLLDLELLENEREQHVHKDWVNYFSGYPMQWKSCFSTACEVETSGIQSHEVPLMWLMPPPGGGEDEELEELRERRLPSSGDHPSVPQFIARSLSVEASASGMARRHSSAGSETHLLELQSGWKIDGRAICRIGVYDRKNCRFWAQGSGFCFDGHRGHLVTCLHLFYDLDTGYPKFLFSENSSYRIMVGMFESATQVPRWTFEAEILAPTEVSVGSTDLCILSLTHKVMEVGKSNTIQDRTVLRRNGPASGALPLPAHLSIVNSNNVNIGQRVALLGFPLFGRGETETICMDQGTVSSISQLQRDITANLFNLGGSSGGPLLDENGHAIAILSRATKEGNLGICTAANRLAPLLEEIHVPLVQEAYRSTLAIGRRRSQDSGMKQL